MKKLIFTPLDRKYIMAFNIVLFSIFILQSLIFNSSYAQTWKWANNVGGTSRDLGLGISIDTAANTYLVGSFSDTAVFASDTLISNGLEDIVIVKFDPSGNLIWVKSAGS
ncbi:MAG: hypothetical protein IIA88_08220, partial [Bacteroidetes bacterium]|nr:hypothetical protein [Bacteroidota bacterium]